MEYLTGVAKKETLEISELLAGDLLGIVAGSIVANVGGALRQDRRLRLTEPFIRSVTWEP